jgi:hypothetical protein
MGTLLKSHWTYGLVGSDTGTVTETCPQRTPTRPTPSFWAGLRDRFRDSRGAGARRALEADLASFTTRAEVDDLLAAMSDLDSPEADQIRTILIRNLADRPSPFTA